MGRLASGREVWEPLEILGDSDIMWFTFVKDPIRVGGGAAAGVMEEGPFTSQQKCRD